MNVHRIKDLTEDERKTVLDGECFSVEESSYMKPLSDQELIEYRAEFSQVSIEISVIQDELKEIKENFKKRLEPLVTKVSSHLAAIKARGLWTKGRVYLMPDHENRVMHIVSSEGIVIDSRMMKPEERQMTIHQNQKSA